MKFSNIVKNLENTKGTKKIMRILRHINASFRQLYQCQSKIFYTFLSKITKCNRVPLGFDPSVA